MVHLTDTGVVLRPDPARLVPRAFLPGGPNFAGAAPRIERIVERVLALDLETRRHLLAEQRERASARYTNIEARWEEHVAAASAFVAGLSDLAELDRLVIGATLTQGYAYEAAALTNPSMVPLGPAEGGTQPFVMSARAIGEGHISSIAFLTGSIDEHGAVTLDPRDAFADNGQRTSAVYHQLSFARKLTELGVDEGVAEAILSEVGDDFTAEDLDEALRRASDRDLDPSAVAETVKIMHWVASSNYRLGFDPSDPISRRLISPAAPAESRGMEDARFVRFVDDDGAGTYYATYTAFDGERVLSQLIQSDDFTQFRISTMSGPTAYHKGLAIFPRRVQGDYLALSRHDHESIFLMRSDTPRHWSNAEVVMRPEFEWEVVQAGNCGSPLETDAGWLVITHGVGPMRRYVLGAMLLDRDEPSKVIGRLPIPLLEPRGDGSVGYVPDVVYSCGAMLHGGLLVLPHGFADHGTAIAVADVADVIAEMI
jgi:predicted GH43/DUF377 family glycosyl hydrolase